MNLPITVEENINRFAGHLAPKNQSEKAQCKRLRDNFTSHW